MEYEASTVVKRICNLSESRGTPVRIWICKLWRVQHVDGFDPKIQPPIPVKSPRAGERRIQVSDSTTPECIETEIAA
jgi:hypothetical protein